MKNQFPFRRGGFGSSPESSNVPQPEHFTQVPAVFTQGLTVEQWKALQETYRAAWERAREQQREFNGEGGGLNYDI